MEKNFHCNKEREIDKLIEHDEEDRIAMAKLTLQIETIKEDVKDVKSEVKESRKDIRQFIESSNKTYATKEELKKVEQNLKEVNLNQDSQIKSMAKKVYAISEKLAVTGVFIWVFAKTNGWV